MRRFIREASVVLFFAFLLGHAASVFVRSGYAREFVTWFNPQDPRRSVERQLFELRKGWDATTLAVGSRPFLDLLRQQCAGLGAIREVEIDVPGWRDLRWIAEELGAGETERIIFQSRPSLWTNIGLSRNVARNRLLAEETLFSGDLFPVKEVRSFFATLEEALKPPATQRHRPWTVPSFAGVVPNTEGANRHFRRVVQIAAKNVPAADIYFVVFADEFPGDTTEDVKSSVFDYQFKRNHKLPMQFRDADDFSKEFECSRDFADSVASRMREVEPSDESHLETDEQMGDPDED